MSIQGSPIQTTSVTFNTVLADINSDPDLLDRPDWFKRLIAGVRDSASIQINGSDNNHFLRTAFTRQAVSDLLQLIDFQIGTHTTASGKEIFHLRTDLGTGIFPVVITKENLAATSLGSLNVSAKRYEARGDETFSLVSDTFTTNAPTDNNLTIATDFEFTAHKVRLTTSGTLPDGLSDSLDFFLIFKNATTVALANSIENAFAGVEISIGDNGSGTHTINLFSKAVDCFQQESKEDIIIGTSDGITEFQQFIIPDALFISGTEVIVINSITWTSVTSFIDSSPTDTHYKIIHLSDNQFAIRFGNNVFGAIPGGFDILASYSFGGGTTSNISSLDRINAYAGSDSNITSATNPQNFTGGADEQSLEEAKILGPLLLKARNRAVTTEDFEALTLSQGGTSIVKANSNAFGVLSVQIIAIALGGGNPSSAKRATDQAFLILRTLLEAVDVRYEESLITSTDVTSAAKMLAGFAFADVKPFFDLAWKLFLSEAGKEITNKFTGSGISDTIVLINTIFGTTFDNTDQPTTTQITKLVDNLEPRRHGVDVQESDAFGFIDNNVDGIDFFTISVPSFPIALDDDEITTPGTLTLTEIP